MVSSVSTILQYTCRAVTLHAGTKLGPFLACCGFLLLPFAGWAQENPPLQTYAHRLFLNPAFTGLLSDYSVTTGYRSQWAGVEGGYNTQWLSGELRFKKSRNAVGITVLHDQSAGDGYQRLQAGASYAYHTKLTKNLDLSAGGQLGFGSASGRTRNLIFEDQLGPGGNPERPTAEVFPDNRSSYFTLAGGFLLFTNQFWAGISSGPVNRPRLGNYPDNSISPLWQVHTGYRFYIRNYFLQNTFQETSVIPTASYTRQGGFSKWEGGLHLVYTPFTIGLVYSHLPASKNITSAHTISGLAGVTYKGFKLGYGYRQHVVGNPVFAGATHELSVSFEKLNYLGIYKQQGSDKNYNRIACPAF